MLGPQLGSINLEIAALTMNRFISSVAMLADMAIKDLNQQQPPYILAT